MPTAGKENLRRDSQVASDLKLVPPSTSECGEKSVWPDFPRMIPSFLPVMFVYWFCKHLLTFSFCTKSSLLPQGVVWGLENCCWRKLLVASFSKNVSHFLSVISGS